MNKTAFQWGFPEFLFIVLVLVVGGVFYFLQQKDDNFVKEKEYTQGYGIKIDLKHEGDKLYFRLFFPNVYSPEMSFYGGYSKEVVLTLKDSSGFAIEKIKVLKSDFDVAVRTNWRDKLPTDPGKKRKREGLFNIKPKDTKPGAEQKKKIKSADEFISIPIPGVEKESYQTFTFTFADNVKMSSSEFRKIANISLKYD